MSERRPLNEKEYYHWYEYQGELTIESECCLDGFSADEEQVLLRYLLGKYPQPTDLTTLRAEVVALRDDAAAVLDRSARNGLGWSQRWADREDAFNQVLDLIDKHTREGQ